MIHKLTPDELADKCEAWLQSGGGASNIVDAFEAGYRQCEEACTAPLLARIAELEAERTRLRAAVVTARDGYISERATGKPVLESWRERTLEMLDKALGDNTGVER